MDGGAGADASDDITQANLPDQVSAICAGDETGNSLWIYGLVGTTLTIEEVELGVAGTYTSVATWAAVYALRTTQESVGAIDIKDATLTDLLIPQIAAETAPRFYGAVQVIDTGSLGHPIQINAGGANTSDVVAFGRDLSGDDDWVKVTLTGTTAVATATGLAYTEYLLIGADEIAFDAGVTSEYDMTVLKDGAHPVVQNPYPEDGDLHDEVPRQLQIKARFTGSAADAAVVTVGVWVRDRWSGEWFFQRLYTFTGVDGISTVQGNIVDQVGVMGSTHAGYEVTGLLANQVLHLTMIGNS
jgi:hypothetical protein